jgi:uncharacterized protein YchJ
MLQECCQPLLDKTAKARTAETLLRSRYTAYALKNADYIADTTHIESQEYTGSRSSYLQVRPLGLQTIDCFCRVSEPTSEALLYAHKCIRYRAS